ncbi:YdcF family protein [Corynebacterium phocae]|nr:YdcF family protein [Corynebacterium phocae]
MGSRVVNGQPGPMLEQRLLTAAALARPGQEIIVTGYLEARAMRDFLLQHRTHPGAYTVAVEPHATSTNENLEYVRAMRPTAARFTVVTSDFHALRTRLWAWHLKIPVQVVSAPTPREQQPYNYLREVFATPHSVARIVLRRLLKPLPWGA